MRRTAKVEFIETTHQQPQIKTIKRKRCPNGMRRNRKTGLCEPYSPPVTKKSRKPEQTKKQDQKQKQKQEQEQEKDVIIIPVSKRIMNNLLELNRNPKLFLARRRKERFTTAKKRMEKSFQASEVQRRKIAVMRMLCNDQNECLALGKETHRVDDLFHFRSFKNVDNIKSLSQGDNGAVYQICYKVNVDTSALDNNAKETKEGKEDKENKYESNAVLKHSIRANSDSGFYEYMVGCKINEWMKYYPCFVETYGCYYSRMDEQYNSILLNNSSLPETRLKELLTPISLRPSIDSVLKKTCREGETSGSATAMTTVDVLIQYLGGGIGYADDNTFAVYVGVVHPPMLTCLYQIYFCLASLRKEFTHYDLHPGNIMGY